MSNHSKRKRGDEDFDGEKKQRLDSTSSEVSSILEQLDFQGFGSTPSTTSNTPMQSTNRYGTGMTMAPGMGYINPQYGGNGYQLGYGYGTNYGYGQANASDTSKKSEDVNKRDNRKSDDKSGKKPQHSYNYSDFEQSLQDSTLSTKSVASSLSSAQAISLNNQNLQNNPMNMRFGVQFPFMNSGLNQGGANENQRREECTAFVTNLSQSVTRNDLKKHFDQCGEVESAVVALDPITKKSKGHAFINFYHSESVDNAIRMFDNTPFGGTTIHVSRKKASRRQNDDSGSNNNIMNTGMGLNPMSMPMNIPPMPYGNTGGYGMPPMNYGSPSYYVPQPYMNPPSDTGYASNMQSMSPSYGYNDSSDQNDQQPDTYEESDNTTYSHKAQSSSHKDHRSPKHQPEESVPAGDSDVTELGDAEVWKDNELMFKFGTVCGKEHHGDFFTKRFAESSKFDLNRFTSKKSFDNWYIMNKKHVRVLEIIPGNHPDDYKKLIETLEKEYSLYVSSDSLKGCIVMTNALNGYPAKHEVMGLFVRSSGRKK